MRKFGEESKEYFEFQLADSDEIYKIPLPAYMPVGDLLAMQEAEGSNDNGFTQWVKILRRHLGDVVDEISAGTVREILLAWASESEAQGATAGESPALSD